ncbi:hypothetical protein BLSTO_01866 [Blastocystis sp. subtype 1]
MVNPSIEIVTFIDAFGVALVITLIPFFTKELGVDAFGFGMITSLYGLCQIVGGCIIGYISKFNVSRKTILLVSAFGSAISYALLLIRNNLYTLVASRMIVGFIKQTTTSCKALVMMQRKENVAKHLSMLATIRHLGSFAGSGVFSYLTKYHGVDTAIRLCVLLFLIETTIVVFWVSGPKEENPITEQTSSEETATDSYKTRRQTKGISLNTTFILYIVYLLLVDSINKGFGSIKVFLPSLPHKQILLLQEQFNVSPHKIGLVYVFSNLFMFITESIITPLASRLFCPFSLVLLSLTLLTAGKFFQLFVHSLFGSFFAITLSPQYVLFCVCCNTIGEEIFATTFVNVLSQISPPRLVDRYLSYYDVTESICRLAGPLLLGKIDTMLGYRRCEQCIMLGFLGIGLLWVTFPVVRREVFVVKKAKRE